MKKYILLLFVFSSVLLVSCTKKIESGAFWGETEYYRDFLWKKYDPIRMEQTLNFDFNGDAKRLLQNKPLHFEVVERNVEGEFVPAMDIILYVDGQECEGNRFEVTTNDKEKTVAVVFKADAREGNHALFLREIGENGLDRVDYTELGEGFVLKKQDITNPLQLALTWTLIIIFIILIVWILLVKFVICPATAFRRVTITYSDGIENVVRLNGAHKLVCTNKHSKCSLLKALFVENVMYEVNEYWTNPVTIMTGRHRNDVKIIGRDVSVQNDKIIRHEQLVIINDTTNEKVMVETN